MEADGHGRMLTVFACEFLGTALFLFGIISTNLPLTIPFSLLASVVIWGDITGGHFNPAVTLGVWTSLGDKGKNFIFMLGIMISQCLGGLAGAGLAAVGQMGTDDPTVPVLAPTNPLTGEPDDADTELGFKMDMNVFVNEIVCTFIFVSVILMVKG